MQNFKDIEMVVVLVKRKVPSARAKNSENQKECDDVMDVNKKLTKQEGNRLKGAI
jgi:hypothetical protein